MRKPLSSRIKKFFLKYIRLFRCSANHNKSWLKSSKYALWDGHHRFFKENCSGLIERMRLRHVVARSYKIKVS